MEDYPEHTPILVRQIHGKDDLNWIWRNRHKRILHGLLITYFYSIYFSKYSSRLTLKNRNKVKKIRHIIKKYCKLDGRRRKMEDIFK